MVQSEARRSYRDLIAWQRAIDLVPTVYRVTKSFPKDELFALTSQVRRAVVSVPANIAEGQGRQHRKEFVQFLTMAKGSLAELHTLLIVAYRLGYLNSNELTVIEQQLGEVRAPLLGLIRKLKLNNPNPNPKP